MDSSKLSWDDIEQDATKAGFKYVSTYVQYCLEYFHFKRFLRNHTLMEIYMVTTSTLLMVLMFVVVFR